MGRRQHTPRSRRVARPLQRRRTCLRKGCGRVYSPSRWNQRYCQDPGCQQLVKRWQAAKRQRAHRRLPQNRKRHAEAEAKRRRDRVAQPPADDGADVEKSPDQDRAWSRSRKIPDAFCDRPGCYEPLPEHSRAPARYCGHDCRRAVRRVRDRERKWLSRKGYRAQRVRSRQTSAASVSHPSATTSQTIHQNAKLVGDSGSISTDTLSCQATVRNSLPSCQQDRLRHADSKTHSHCRSRPPPTS
jgi:hypothetical protein